MLYSENSFGKPAHTWEPELLNYEERGLLEDKKWNHLTFI